MMNKCPSNATQPLSIWQSRAQAQIELTLSKWLPSSTTSPERLHEAMRYATLNGGKRLRPMLVLAAAEIDSPHPDMLEKSITAVECIHVYSLVHDDMPEMDNDTLRRGKPTCHIAYDQATALLVGDALQSLAFELLSQPCDFPTSRQLNMIHTLAHASGSLGMAGGQAIDLSNIGKSLTESELAHMHRLKTGALITASVTLGALSCPNLSESTLAPLKQYASYLGLAFQVIDDILDYEQDTEVLGKTAGKDYQANKPTYVSILGLEQARHYAHSLVKQALSALAPIQAPTQYLKELANLVIQRQH